MEGLDYFVPNESEAETITGMPVKNVEDAKKCAEKLLSYGIRRVIITLGANGSLLAGKEGMEHLPAFPVKSIDSTGRRRRLYRQLCRLPRRRPSRTRGRAPRESVRRTLNHRGRDAEIVL